MTKTTKANFHLLEQRDAVLRDIRRAIITGRYAPGAKLVETALSAEFSLKRNRIREILKELTTEGFVNSVPFVGAFVSEISQKDIAQTYDLLGVLEGLALRVAAPMLSDAEIEHFEAMAHAIQDAHSDPEEMFKRNRQFHQSLAECSNNERLVNFVTLLRRHTRRISLSFFYDKYNADHSYDQHMSIIASLRSRDGQRVEQEIRKHYTDARDALLRALNCCV